MNSTKLMMLISQAAPHVGPLVEAIEQFSTAQREERDAQWKRELEEDRAEMRASRGSAFAEHVALHVAGRLVTRTDLTIEDIVDRSEKLGRELAARFYGGEPSSAAASAPSTASAE